MYNDCADRKNSSSDPNNTNFINFIKYIGICRTQKKWLDYCYTFLDNELEFNMLPWFFSLCILSFCTWLASLYSKVIGLFFKFFNLYMWHNMFYNLYLFCIHKLSKDNEDWKTMTGSGNCSFCQV